MLEYIKGIVAKTEDDKLIVETVGLGFEVIATKELLSYVRERENKAGNNEPVLINVYVYFSEEGPKIFGFASKLEKTAFIDLISVPDIGPSKAIKILSRLSIDILVDAILQEKVDLLSEIPGIGFKSAKKLVTFLKDKFMKYQELEAVSRYSNIYLDLKKALKQLGYKESEINVAIEKINKKGFKGGLDEAIRECITLLSQ